MNRTIGKAAFIYKKRTQLVALVALLMSLMDAGTAKSALSVTYIRQGDIPYTISQPGRYALAEDLSGPQNAIAITILASNVTLYLNNHRLTGPASSWDACYHPFPFPETSVGIRVIGATHVILRKGFLQGFGTGVLLTNAGSSQLNSLQITQTCWHAIDLDASSGNSIQDNHVSGNFGDGIFLYRSDNNTFHANELSDNGSQSNGAGMSLVISHANTLTANTISRNRSFGISIACSNDNQLVGNTVDHNDSGISGGCGDGAVSGNLFDGNLSSDNRYGIVLGTGSTHNTIVNNIAQRNALFGIMLYDNSLNIVKNNTALDNQVFDAYDVNLPSCGNIWRKNTFNTDNEGDGPATGCIR